MKHRATLSRGRDSDTKVVGPRLTWRAAHTLRKIEDDGVAGAEGLVAQVATTGREAHLREPLIDLNRDLVAVKFFEGEYMFHACLLEPRCEEAALTLCGPPPQQRGSRRYPTDAHLGLALVPSATGDLLMPCLWLSALVRWYGVIGGAWSLDLERVNLMLRCYKVGYAGRRYGVRRRDCRGLRNALA